MVYVIVLLCVLSYALVGGSLVGGFLVWLLAGVPRCDRPWHVYAWLASLWLLSPFFVAFAGTAAVLSLVADRRRPSPTVSGRAGSSASARGASDDGYSESRVERPR